MTLLPKQEEKPIDRATNFILHFMPLIVLQPSGKKRFRKGPNIDEKTLFPFLKEVTVKWKVDLNILEKIQPKGFNITFTSY